MWGISRKDHAMANTYTQIYLQVVFAVQGRQCLIRPEHQAELYKYITGIVRHRDQKLIAINGVADHVHLLIGMKPDIALSDLVRDIKAGSSNFINQNRWVRGRFHWQEGFGGFSYGHSQQPSSATFKISPRITNSAHSRANI